MWFSELENSKAYIMDLRKKLRIQFHTQSIFSPVIVETWLQSFTMLSTLVHFFLQIISYNLQLCLYRITLLCFRMKMSSNQYKASINCPFTLYESIQLNNLIQSSKHALIVLHGKALKLVWEIFIQNKIKKYVYNLVSFWPCKVS